MTAAGGCWPTPEQELLLRAALLGGDPARDAWERWHSRVADLGDLDHGSVRLLPLLYRNLRELGVEHPRMELLKGTYRKAWYQNRVLLHRLAGVLRRLRERGVEPMVLKGAALAATSYPDIALRPMNDVDVLVRSEEVAVVAAALRDLGLHALWDVASERHSVIHAASFEDDHGFELDLHWHALREDCTAATDELFWSGAVPVAIDGVPTLAPAPTELLLHTCVHGVQWDPEPPLRWVADAAVVVRGGGVDWERLGAAARSGRVALALGAALAYADRLLDLGVPARLIGALAEAPAAAWERRARRLQMRPLTELRRLRLHWYHHRRQRGGAGGLPALATFPRYLRLFWGLQSVLGIPRYLAVGLPAVRRRSVSGR